MPENVLSSHQSSDECMLPYMGSSKRIQLQYLARLEKQPERHVFFVRALISIADSLALSGGRVDDWITNAAKAL